MIRWTLTLFNFDVAICKNLANVRLFARICLLALYATIVLNFIFNWKERFYIPIVPITLNLHVAFVKLLSFVVKYFIFFPYFLKW